MADMPRSHLPRRPSAAPGKGKRRNKWQAAAEERPVEDMTFGFPSRQSARDGEWHVRRIAGHRAEKHYTCPGCHLQIAPGVEHIVAWRADHWSGDEVAAAGRRHWHAHCWNTRTGR